MIIGTHLINVWRHHSLGDLGALWSITNSNLSPGPSLTVWLGLPTIPTTIGGPSSTQESPNFYKTGQQVTIGLCHSLMVWPITISNIVPLLFVIVCHIHSQMRMYLTFMSWTECHNFASLKQIHTRCTSMHAREFVPIMCMHGSVPWCGSQWIPYKACTTGDLCSSLSSHAVSHDMCCESQGTISACTVSLR
jgi:hypothetical protein